MITAINDPFEIDAKYNWEESDLMVAKTLSFETEQRLLELARDIRTSFMSKPLSLPPEDQAAADREALYLRGKYDLLLFLVSESKEAKVEAHLI